MQATAGAAPEGSSTGILSLIARSTAISLAVLLDPRTAVDLVLGHLPLQVVDVSARGETKRAVSRSVPPQQQVLRGAGGLPVARRQPARRPVSDRLRRTDGAAAADRRRARPGTDSNPRAPAGRPTLKSLPAVDRALLRASAVEVNKLESRVSFLATMASMAPFIGLFGTVVGHHECVRTDRRDRIDESAGGRRPGSPKRSSRPRPAWWRRFRRCSSTTTCRSA